jgi:mono/diheme cytochrome c family protein
VSIRLPVVAFAIAAAFALAPVGPASSQDNEIPDLNEDILSDPELINRGQELFADQCTLCHGRTAYPGKAPLLRPSRYEAEFVYHRVAFGFRDMPAWEGMYPEEDLVAVVAYIMSDRFAH